MKNSYYINMHSGGQQNKFPYVKAKQELEGGELIQVKAKHGLGSGERNPRETHVSHQKNTAATSRLLCSLQISVLLSIILVLTACTSIPPSEKLTIRPVPNFELERYLGKWYEIARLDHYFERGLELVTAEYTLMEDGGIKVTNSGYNSKKERMQTSVGKAYAVETPDLAYLKVSFFGPFYGAYVIFELDYDDYQYAFITSDTKDYLWFLSRTPEVSYELTERFLTRAKELGFNTDEIIFVPQDCGCGTEAPAEAI